MASGSVNNFNPNVDQTVHIFDNFYKYEANIPQMEYDAVNSYFLSVFGTKQQADSFTVTIFRIAQESNISAMTLLQDFQGMSAPELNLTLAYYLNALRSPTTLLGIAAQVVPNYYVAHNVRA